MGTLDVMHVAATEMRNSIFMIRGLEALLTWCLAALNVLKPRQLLVTRAALDAIRERAQGDKNKAQT